MNPIDAYLPAPRLHQADHIDVGVPLDVAWPSVRRVDFGMSPLVRALFALRTLPARLHGNTEPLTMNIDAVASQPHGFRILDEQLGSSITVGAIAKPWKTDVEFAEVPAQRYAAFADPGWVKVIWELRCDARGEAVTRISIDLRVGPTDDGAWRQFTRYWAVIGPFSHFIRRHLLALMAHKLGTPRSAEERQPLPGDDLIRDSIGQVTFGVTIKAPPEAIWPWLVQMGCRRAGWYSYDALDNAGVPSAHEIVPALQSIKIGDILPYTPKGTDGFEVLMLDPPRALVLGHFLDTDTERTLPFGSSRPHHYSQGTWAFVLEPLNGATRLHVRNRLAMRGGSLSSRAWTLVMALVHPFMQTEQLRNLRERVESTAVGST